MDDRVIDLLLDLREKLTIIYSDDFGFSSIVADDCINQIDAAIGFQEGHLKKNRQPPKEMFFFKHNN